MKKTYIAKTPLLLDGVKYPIGSEVDLEDAQADRMARVVELKLDETMTDAEHAAHQKILDDNDKAFAENQARKEAEAKAKADAKAKAEADASDDNTDGTDETGAGGSTEDDSGDGVKSVLEQVVGAIADMKVNDANYTKKGDLSKGAKPYSVVLDNLLDFDVSATLRDEAWAKYQDNN